MYTADKRLYSEPEVDIECSVFESRYVISDWGEGWDTEPETIETGEMPTEAKDYVSSFDNGYVTPPENA